VQQRGRGHGRGTPAWTMWPIARSMPAFRQGQPRTNKRKCGTQPANQSLITDVFRSRPHPCTIYRPDPQARMAVRGRSIARSALDEGHQSPVARNGPPAMSDLSPLSGAKQKSASATSTSEFDPTADDRPSARIYCLRIAQTGRPHHGTRDPPSLNGCSAFGTPFAGVGCFQGPERSRSCADAVALRRPSR
jgi:hypothetical protein